MHYPSDCAAAVVEGLLWVAICHAGTSPLAQPSPDEQALVR
jgi:hypothetical protein